MELKKNELYYTCENCKKTTHISIKPLIHSDKKFCSYACHTEYELKERQEKTTCNYCENIIPDHRFSINDGGLNFCNVKCYSEYSLRKEKEIKDIMAKAIIKNNPIAINELFNNESETIKVEFERGNKKNDPVKNPNHYNWIPGIECKDVVKYFSFHIGNAIKYLWRHKYKGKVIEDLQKAIENINCEIEFLKEQEAEKPQE